MLAADGLKLGVGVRAHGNMADNLETILINQSRDGSVVQRRRHAVFGLPICGYQAVPATISSG
jgi:hypothetical protein